MKRFFPLIVSIIMMLSFPFAESRASLFGSTPAKRTTIKLKGRPTGGTSKPSKPAEEYIEVTYYPENSVFVFELPEDISQLTGRLADCNTGNRWEFPININYPYWHVTLATGLYALACTDQWGNVYEGLILLE